MSFTVAIIGRPNVGKSTLFNRMVRKKMAIVDDTPGITRDWQVADADFMDLKFKLLDTAGLEENFDDSIEARMRKTTENALKHTNFILFMVDARSGLTSLDKHFAKWLREQNIPSALIANKCESSKLEEGLYEAYELGMGEPICISAEHGVGMNELYTIIKSELDKYQNENIFSASMQSDDENLDKADFNKYEEGSGVGFGEEEINEDEINSAPIKIAIIGRPNAGKSTLLNSLLGEDRTMTGPEAGITRDAISVDWQYEGKNFCLVDTAGIRKKAKITDKIEKFSVEDSFRAIRLAQIVILMLDAENMLEKQDLSLAAHVVEEGRALVIAINKWDIAKDKANKIEEARYKLEKSLGQVKDVSFVTISALKKKGLKNLIKTTISTYDIWNKRIGTGRLNRWLKMMEIHHPPPLAQGRPNRLRYITQVKSRPPSFALWVSKPKDITDSYKRYLINGLREAFDMPAVPIRITIKTSKNPYIDN